MMMMMMMLTQTAASVSELKELRPDVATQHLGKVFTWMITEQVYTGPQGPSSFKMSVKETQSDH